MTTKFATLHEAIIDVLKRNGDSSFDVIATTIAAENLWRRKIDNQHPEAFQIKLRTTVQKKYKHLFEQLNNGTIRLKM